MEQQGMPLSIGVIIAAAILGAVLFAGMVVMAILTQQ